MYANIYSAMNARKVQPAARPITRALSATFSTENISVEHDQRNSEFYVKMQSNKAFIEYTQNSNLIVLKETEVPDVFQGRGVGKILARFAFDYIAKNNLQMKIECTFLQHYLDTYAPEYKKFLAK